MRRPAEGAAGDRRARGLRILDHAMYAVRRNSSRHRQGHVAFAVASGVAALSRLLSPASGRGELPLPLAGEGWGGGVSTKPTGRVDSLPPPAALRAIAEAQLRRLI